MRKLHFILILSSVYLILSLQTSAQTLENKRGELPPPTGPYGVGRASFHWIDSSRLETMTADTKDHRELMVHIFYPTRPNLKGEPAPYFPSVALMRDYEEKHFGNDFMRQEYGEAYDSIFTARIHTIANARLSDEKRKYPVLVFQPGLGIKVFLYTAIIENLASHGYVVAAIEPTFETSLVVFPDGRIIEEHDNWGNIFMKGTPKESARFHLDRLDVNAADNSFVLDQLEKVSSGKITGRNPDFKGRLNTRQAGAFGHSQGGLAARRSCQIDARWKGCIDLGGGLNDEEIEEMGNGVMRHPFMLMTPVMVNKKFVSHDNALLRNGQSGSYKISVDAPGFGHFIYCDLELPGAKREASRNGLSASDRLRATQIIRAYTLAFFNQSILGKKELLLDGPSKDYFEVTLEKFERVTE